MLLRHRDEGIRACKAIWMKATDLQRYANESGSGQWSKKNQKLYTANLQPAGNRAHARLGVNEISQIIQTLSGRQMMARLERSYEPRSARQQLFAEAMTLIDKALMQASDAEQVESAAFKDGPGIQGVSCIRYEYDTISDEKGRIVLTDWPIWQTMWNGSARQINLKDRTWHRIAMWVPAAQVKERWGAKWEKVRNLVASQPWASIETSESSSRTPWTGGDGNLPMDQFPYYSEHHNELWVEYEEWKERETVYKVGVPQDPGSTYAQALSAGTLPDGRDTIAPVTMTRKELTEWKAQHTAATGEEVPAELVVSQVREKYQYAYVCGETVLETGLIPIGQFTLLFLTGFRYPQPDRTDWIGLTERLVEVQQWMNLLLTATMKLLEVNPKGVLVYEQGTFRSKKEAMQEWASTGGTIEVPRGKLQGGNPPYRYEAGGSSGYQQMIDPLFAFYREAIPRLAGFNPGALGQLGTDLRRISGEVLKSVQDAAMASNGELFDSLRQHRVDGGRMVLAFIRTFWADRPQDLVDMVGEENLQYTDADSGQVVSAIPPAEMWTPSAWRQISVEEVAPVGDALDSLWESLAQNGALQILQQPQTDTGQPLFSSEDLIRSIPRLPAAVRNKMVLRTRQLVQLKQQQAAQDLASGQNGQQQGQQGQQPQQAAAS